MVTSFEAVGRLRELVEAMQAWASDALCRAEVAAGRAQPDWWFPERGQGASRAKAICERCPVRSDCFAHAMTAPERHGIWGGENERARRRMRRAGTERTCHECGRRFRSQHPNAKYCSARCRRLGERAYQREYQRRRPERVNGKRLEEGHGTISRYQKGCKCMACRRASRDRKRAMRAKRGAA